MSWGPNTIACMRCDHGQRCPANHCVCDLDGILTDVHAHAGSCTIGKHVKPDPNAPPYVAPPVVVQTPGQNATAALWRELHLRALYTVDLSGEAAWLAGWLAKLPCGDCKVMAAKWLSVNPWDLSSPAAYFAHTVAFHNSVNAVLHRGLWTVEDAKATLVSA
jgi:hypothetical protein